MDMGKIFLCAYNNFSQIYNINELHSKRVTLDAIKKDIYTFRKLEKV